MCLCSSRLSNAALMCSVAAVGKRAEGTLWEGRKGGVDFGQDHGVGHTSFLSLALIPAGCNG